ncbi:hypothetical protein, partial [Solemya elarraichensis gill symbiont]
NLSNGKYMPYSKPNNVPLYVHSKSNHPPRILKNIPESINKRLSEISCDEESFKKSTAQYQKALDKSGYKFQLSFSPATSNSTVTDTQKKRKRNIIWYNPPFSKNVATNVGKTFLRILHEEFPKENILYKLFNKNTVKVSYSCLSNLKQTIDGHNKATLSKGREIIQTKDCNCRRPIDCPLSGRCLKQCVVYQATIKSNDAKPDQTYVGLTENTFKTRYSNHKASFRNPSMKSSTELSKYVWELKEKNTDYEISWTILKQAKPYNTATGRCNLCLWEKFFIICKPELSTLNKRNELVTACRHANKFLLKNFT